MFVKRFRWLEEDVEDAKVAGSADRTGYLLPEFPPWRSGSRQEICRWVSPLRRWLGRCRRCLMG